MNEKAKQTLRSFKRERKEAERARQAERAAARAAKRTAWAEALLGVTPLNRVR